MIKEIREKLGWSQMELARRSGVKQSALSQIEAGIVNNPRIDTMMKIAEALGVTVDQLVKEVKNA